MILANETTMFRGGTEAGLPLPSAGSRATPGRRASASDTYHRIRASVCPWHGLGDDAELEQHVRLVTEHVLRARGQA